MTSESSKQRQHPAIGRCSHQGQGDKKQPKIISLPTSQNIYLHESENIWRPGHTRELTTNEEMTEEELFRKICCILNELTPQKFQSLVDQVKELRINNMKKLEGTVNLIYEKAVDEPNCTVLYAKMCKQLALINVPLEGGQRVVYFRKLLITKCQKEFERGKSGRKMKEIKIVNDEEKCKELQLEIDAEEKKMRWRRLGNVIFIGELFKLDMLIEPIMHECIKELLAQGDDESLECVCLLLKTIGKELNEKGKQSGDTTMDSYYVIMQKLVDKHLTSSRVRFMLQDVIDLKEINKNMKQEKGREETDVTGNTFDSDDSSSLHSSSDLNAEVEKENSVKENTNGHSMVFLDSTWTFGGELSVKRISTKGQEITWSIPRFLNYFWREKEIASPKFCFANVTWYFCFSMDSKKNRCLFAINVLTQSSSDPECDFYCSISFLDVSFRVVKNIKCDFKCESALWTVTNFLSSSEIDNFERSGTNIVCRISMKNLRVKEACIQTDISYFTHSAVEAHTQLSEKADEELPMPGFDYKVLQDFKNLCLNGEGSDVTLQVEDQQFKAHRSFLIARSSVFAAMFNCDMKEKATGHVNVDDCDISSFPVFLEYLYCGSTEKLSSENIFNLYVSADKYDVQDLKRKCLQFMKSNLSMNTFCETLEIALQYSETDLLKLATEFFIRNVKDIILTKKWQTFILENPIQEQRKEKTDKERTQNKTSNEHIKS